ncbi:MAG: alpha/beta fold hydrolase [Clostridiales bacterium]|nr:alpha/beta fold hydrolase [Clostridiales bacterium]
MDYDYTKTPVVFVHGHGMTSSSWNSLVNYLCESGYPKEYLRAIQLTPNDGPNIEAAEKQIAPFVEQFLADVNQYLVFVQPMIQPKTKVDIVSHSMGALSARWYAAKIRPERIRTWVSLAGANHGSDALCLYVGRDNGAADDVCPAFADAKEKSLIQFVLNGLPHLPDVDETPYGLGRDSPGVKSIPPDEDRSIFYITVRKINDEWIIPYESAILDGAGGKTIAIPVDLPAIEDPPGNIQMKHKVRHDPMLEDEKTMRLLRTILELK